MADLAAAMGLTPLGLLWLLGAVIAAGIVRGFAGFGSALILMPVASTVLDPFAALAFLTAVELFGPLLNLPAAWREGAPREAGLLLLGAVAGLPVGLWLLSLMSADMFSGVVSGAVFAVVALLLLGWRYEGTLPKAGLGGIGVLGGVLAGAAGLAGPPVILLYLASRRAIAVIRANFLLYLLGSDLLMLGYLAALGRLDPSRRSGRTGPRGALHDRQPARRAPVPAWAGRYIPGGRLWRHSGLRAGWVACVDLAPGVKARPSLLRGPCGEPGKRAKAKAARCVSGDRWPGISTALDRCRLVSRCSGRLGTGQAEREGECDAAR